VGVGVFVGVFVGVCVGVGVALCTTVLQELLPVSHGKPSTAAMFCGVMFCSQDQSVQLQDMVGSSGSHISQPAAVLTIEPTRQHLRRSGSGSNGFALLSQSVGHPCSAKSLPSIDILPLSPPQVPGEAAHGVQMPLTHRL
jgi:hypothetical protein